MLRRFFLKSLSTTPFLGLAGFAPSLAPSDRQYWVSHLDKLARPVLENLANNRLKATMPVEEKKNANRASVSHLEAFGRLMAGIGPWLNRSDITDPTEQQLHVQCTQWARQALDNATNPAAADFMNFKEGGQPLVDAAFLAHGLVRAPRLWESMPESVKKNTAAALLSSRIIRPGPSNWLLFSGMVEAFFAKYGYDYDKMRLDYAIRQHEQWYKGDGIYGDGANFHWDYYNSFVIQPFLYDILTEIVPKERVYQKMYEDVTKRAVRYAAVQERLIAPDGTYPVIGRSIVYRAGAFQHLANMALHEKLPEGVSPAQVRSALTAVIKKTTESPANFDKNGWLTIGLNGHQPGLGESYISTGSLYLCAEVLLPLGLPEGHAFWSGAATDWTSRKVWSGTDLPADHAI
ncbi:hypothetical protein HNQ92_002782 [Rhabdobacter roseus]|uniref:DUF2264 domain-containing protein n=1 Tax=Rhabdobacter roseus TaxID=1655419 RepID=A0A840TYB8_9BACT|nr:DUF2264 domain-containing protein [Rhabdobacter roseus]MBB5284639.1 hypothetical protein [Rhabdobacter roseus]